MAETKWNDIGEDMIWNKMELNWAVSDKRIKQTCSWYRRKLRLDYANNKNIKLRGTRLKYRKGHGSGETRVS